MKSPKDVANLQTLAEAKYVLLQMMLNDKPAASLVELETLTGLPIQEISLGAQCLSTLGINVSKSFDFIKLSEKWYSRQASLDAVLQESENG